MAKILISTAEDVGIDKDSDAKTAITSCGGQ